jgi:hypothetical protein
MRKPTKALVALLLCGAVGVNADVVRTRGGGSGSGVATAVTPGTTTVTGCQNLVLYGDNSSVLNCEAAFGYVTSTNTLTADTMTAAAQLIVPAGTAGAGSSIFFSNDTDTGIYSPAAGNIGVTVNNQERYRFASSGDFVATASIGVGAIAGGDVIYGKHATNVGKISSSVAGTSIRYLMGGGVAVASATALPAPTGSLFHVTGTTVITSITATNLGAGACFTMIFDGITTVTDGGNLILAGNFVTTADDTLSVCFDGTNFYETARAVN